MYITLASAGVCVKMLHKKKITYAPQNTQSQSFETRNVFMIYGRYSPVSKRKVFIQRGMPNNMTSDVEDVFVFCD